MMLFFNSFFLLSFLFLLVKGRGPFFLAFFLLFYSVALSFFVRCCCVSIYGFLLFLVIGGSIVVAFLFAVSILEIHNFYVDKFDKRFWVFFLFGFFLLCFCSRVFLGKFNDFFVCLMYSSFVLLGLAVVIVFCLLGVVKSCSYGSGPLRALNFM